MSRRFGLGLLSSLIAVLGASACQPQGPSIDTAALAERACAALHGLPAARKQACCGGSATSLAATCSSALEAALERGTIRLESGAIDRCAADSATALQGCDWVSPLLPAAPASCANLLQGQLGAGAVCESSLECGAGLACQGGRCAAAVSVGEACDVRPDGLAVLTRQDDAQAHPRCAGVCLRGSCLARLAEGAQCAATAQCVDGLHCADGRCRQGAPPSQGQACSAQSGCAPGLVCADGLCGTPKPAGARCTLPLHCRSLACVKSADAEYGECADACAVAGAPLTLP